MKVIEAQTLHDGRHRFIVEAVPATEDAEAVTETFTWGADVPLAAAKRETRLLLAAKHSRTRPVRIPNMVGRAL